MSRQIVPEPTGSTENRFEAGSFRDPEGRVFSDAGRVLRALSTEGLAQWKHFAASGLAERLTTERKLIRSTPVEMDAAVLPAGAEAWAGVLEHEVVPFVSYPFEWSFEMLRDAASLQLDLLEECLKAGLTMKDATPYNVQWIGSSPRFIDVGSFEAYRAGAPWVGYRQFCQLYLYPLMLEAYRGVSYRPWLRGRLEGITPAEMVALASRWDLFRPGMLLHAWLHARLIRRHAASDAATQGLSRSGFSADMILTNVRALKSLVARLKPQKAASVWVDYREHNTYDAANAEKKRQFIRQVASSHEHALVWDLGCNTGEYSRIAAETARTVVAMDSDAATIDRLFRELQHEKNQKIVPLVADIADQVGGVGWRGRERRSLEERGRPDLVLALALIHHLSFSSQIPVAETVAWFASLGAELVIEFVEPDDPMATRLRLGSTRRHDDYRRDHFERCLAAHFDRVESVELQGGLRRLYRAMPRR